MRELTDITPVTWKDAQVVWIDQTKIPWEETWKHSNSIEELALGIEALEIRGAPAIGVAAAYGVALAAFNAPNGREAFLSSVQADQERLRRTRPTAVNLFWALDRMLETLDICSTGDWEADSVRAALLREAKWIHQEDIDASKAMGRHGNELISDGDVILTHCNAGALATGGWGTSYAVIRTAWQAGKDIQVIATYTAPLYQGARLTMWELTRDGIPATLITDNMAAYAMQNHGVSKVILGSDRILLSGLVANKIGTYGLSVLARYHEIPFYVVAPCSTIDGVGTSIPIEHRNPNEVRTILGRFPITVPDAKVLNPAFDITPPELVSAIITEHGVARQPYPDSLAAMKKDSGK